MTSRRDVLPAWTSLPRVVIGHVTEYLDVRALGVSACVGQYTLRSALATAWCRRAGGGVKSAGAAIRILQREARERAMGRGPVAHPHRTEALYSGSHGRSLDDLRFRIIIQGTRADGSTVSMDWGDVRVGEGVTGSILTVGVAIGESMNLEDVGQVLSRTPTPGKVLPSSNPFFAWLRAIASDDDNEMESAMRHGVNASITVRRGDAVVELARFGVGGGAHCRTDTNDNNGGDFIYWGDDAPAIMRLHHTRELNNYLVEYPREWTSEHGYIWDRLWCDATVTFDAVSGSMEPKSAYLAIYPFHDGEEDEIAAMGFTEIRHTLHALLDAELVRAARDDLPAEVPFP